MTKPITIVGGGLAGLTLGIALRRRDVPVTIFEAGNYPRHRVCGEFISGRGQGVLEELGLKEELFAHGAQETETAAFFSKNGGGNVEKLPASAWSISRYVLDQLLAEKFRAAGGNLESGTRWQNEFAEGMVRATGRRIQVTEGDWRWFGLKVHVRGIEMKADLEMHLQPGGYVGLCRLAEGGVNVCGLFRSRQAVPDLAKTWRAWLQGVPGSELHRRLAPAEFLEESFCSVSGLSLSPRRAVGQTECSIGDAITMIAPVTGNGMSMAFESAALAVEPLVDYCEGKESWDRTQNRIANACDERFSKRLRWGAGLQRLVFHPVFAERVVNWLPRLPGAWKMFVTQTR